MGLTKKQWMTLVVVVIGTFVTILNQTLVTPALPSIMRELDVDASMVQWLTTGFTLVNAIMIPITAYLQDRFSVRRLFLFSMSVFAVGTLLCGWAPNFWSLLGGRLVQAMGAGILMPLSMTVLLVMFPVERRGSAMGVFGLIIAFAPAIGPTISGIMVDTTGWHIMFYVVAVLVAIVILLAAFLIKQVKPKNSSDSKLDPLSVVLSTLGFGGLLYGFSVLGSSGFDAMSIAIVVIGALCLVWFFIRQTRLQTPMLRVKILFNRKFLIATIIGMLVQASLLVAPVLMPIYIQNLMGYPATVSGLIIMPGAIIMGIMNPIAGRIFDKHGARAMGIIGMIMLALSTCAFGFVGADTSVILITVLFAVRMFAMALVNMPITTWGMNALDVKYMNHGTSINNTLRQVAGSLGTALIVSIYTAIQMALGGDHPAVSASITAFNAAFFVCTGLVIIGLVLTIIFVKGKPGTIEAEEVEPIHTEGISLGDKDLLAEIMKRDVYMLRADDTVKAAMQLFTTEGISACPIVDDDGKPVGFISDGDILKNLARRTQSFTDPVALIATTVQDGRDYNEKLEQLMEMPVLSIGKKNLVSVNINTDIGEVCRVLAEHHLKKVPVMENGRICGIINRSDITRYSMESYLKGRPQDAVYCGEEGPDGTPECGPEKQSEK